jgi:membrane protease YdiL (CAAX protease family)
MIENTTSANHSFGKSLFLHLFPGLLTGICYYALLNPVHRWGYPSMMALLMSIVVVLVPVELGYLLYLGKKENGKLSLQNIVHYRNSIPVKQYFIWVPIIIIMMGIIFTLLKPVDIVIQNYIFNWLPPFESGLQGGFSKSALVLTYAILAFFGAVVAPIVEELYFRGYLLPRMGFAGKWAPILHSLFFGLYHMWTPWMFVTRTFGMLPLIYAVKKKNLYVGIIAHCLINLVDVISGVVFILGMSGGL